MLLKKLSGLIVSGFLLVNIYGCVALLAGTAGGAGTAAWLSNKLSLGVNAGFEQTVKSAKSALESMKLQITKETTENNVAQLIGKYTDGKTFWVDIHRISDSSSRVEVRVGAVTPDKKAAAKILKRINGYL